jgi:hypothetical protein
MFERFTENARFCPQCGSLLNRPDAFETEPSVQGTGWDRFFLMLVGSIGVSVLLTMVFHIPIFILGAVLPMFWLRRKR